VIALTIKVQAKRITWSSELILWEPKAKKPPSDGLQKRLKGKVLINSECVARLEAR